MKINPGLRDLLPKQLEMARIMEFPYYPLADGETALRSAEGITRIAKDLLEQLISYRGSAEVGFSFPADRNLF